jgi:glyoxylase-like metal-dependent hydrolase (beta-lactamase superfamily II)
LERKRAPDAGQHEARLWNVVTLGEIRFSGVSSDARRERSAFIMVLLAPQQSISLGAIRITYLPDGEFAIPPAVLYPQASAEHWSANAHLIGKDGRLVSNVGAHVIQTDAQTLLVDAGVGPRTVNIDELQCSLRGGELLQSLKQAGLSPDDIDTVFYTHLHPDHVGWTGHTVNGKHALTFPRARYVVRREEWLKFEQPAASRAGVEEALDVLTSRIEWLEDGQALAPDVRVQATPGHTPGHSSLVITSSGRKVVLLGDIFHTVIGIDHPEWIDALDENANQAVQTRQRMLQELAHPATMASGIHLWPSAFGRLVPGAHGAWAWQANVGEASA